ncbi:mitochondrial outer membrane porin [Lolium perenne]|uniref:mitochondrial outer membrane porin n=1 Tax=Lolium perenne TaxID=4522 RepID=UPI003A99EF4B
MEELGLETSSIVDNELEELFELSLRMFDTRLPPGVTVLSPFAEDSSLTKVAVEAITATSTKKGDLILGEIPSQIKNKGITVDVKANSASNVITTITADEYAAPGLKTIFSFAVPDQKSGKVELQYLHDYAGINASIGLTANPVVNLSAAFGNSALAVGADVSLDTATKNLTKYNAGLSYTNKDLIASLNL